MNNLKGVLRSATAMFLFVGLFGIWMGGCQTQEQKEIKRLIGELQDQDEDSSVRSNAAIALGRIGGGAVDAVPALIQLLQDQSSDVRLNAAVALKNIGTPEALKAVKEYQSRQ